ncbi:MAG: ABC transporter permease subunit [Christensenellaceae bacterium]|nr:ABC transporter permease subunit [Christensenellaceae bacterium]
MQKYKNNISLKHKIISIAIALIVWQLFAILINNKLLLVSPIKVTERLSQLIFTREYWLAISFSLLRIVLGFTLAIAIGLIFAVIANKYKIVDILLWPYITAMKATPVTSFIILCLIWLSTKTLSILTVFLIVFPIVYSNIFEALNTVDIKLLEMANVFKMKLSKRIRCIYIPHIMPFINSTVTVAIGMSWKAGVAAEVIGMPRGSIGSFMYEAKLYLSTADLFAWTATIIALSMLLERLLSFFLKLTYKKVINLKGDKL